MPIIQQSCKLALLFSQVQAVKIEWMRVNSVREVAVILVPLRPEHQLIYKP